MKNEKLGKHIQGLVDNYKEREGIERIGAAIRANEKQVGGDHYKNMGVEPWDVWTRGRCISALGTTEAVRSNTSCA